MEENKKKELERFSAQMRVDILEMLLHRGYGHLGGSLSIVEVLSVLYGYEMHVDPLQPDLKTRDRLVLSKGHAGPALYCALAARGFFDKKKLMTMNEGGTMLPSHPDRLKTPGVDMTCGSLGQGASVAAGIAIGLRMKKCDSYVYLIIGDGELNEGQCWEAFQFLASYRLHNCIVFIDNNKRQLDGYTKDVINSFDIEAKMRAFGFYTQHVKGNAVDVIADAIKRAKQVKNQAVCIILDTVKGQGIKFFEDMDKNHAVKFNTDELINEMKKAIYEQKKLIGGDMR